MTSMTIHPGAKLYTTLSPHPRLMVYAVEMKHEDHENMGEGRGNIDPVDNWDD